MHVIHDGRRSRNGGFNVVLMASIFIVAAILFLGRNLGFVDHHVFRIIISWQMLLIVLGINSLFRKQTVGGGGLIGVGVLKLLPRSSGLGYDWEAT